MPSGILPSGQKVIYKSVCVGVSVYVCVLACRGGAGLEQKLTSCHATENKAKYETKKKCENIQGGKNFIFNFKNPYLFLLADVVIQTTMNNKVDPRPPCPDLLGDNPMTQ